MRYVVNTFDVCVSGYERLRSNSEFLLVASIDADTTATELLEQWTSDIEACERSDDFDYAQAKQCVNDYYTETVHPLFAKRKNPFNIETGRSDLGFSEDEGCRAFLFICDIQAT